MPPSAASGGSGAHLAIVAAGLAAGTATGALASLLGLQHPRVGTARRAGQVGGAQQNSSMVQVGVAR